MQQVNRSVLNSMILGRNHFCCLCFKTVPDSAIHIEDKVIVRKNDKTFEEICMSDILTNVLGSEINDQLLIFNAVCNKCSSKAIKSYKFLANCKDHLDKLCYIMDGLTNATEVCASNVKGFKAAFVTVNTENFKCSGYNSLSTASTCLLAYQKYQRKLSKIELKNKAAMKTVPVPMNAEPNNRIPVPKHTKPDKRRNEKHKILILKLVRLNPRVINNKHGKVIVCPNCDKFFARRHSMNKHNQTKHLTHVEEDPFNSPKMLQKNEIVYTHSSDDSVMVVNNAHSVFSKIESEKCYRRVPNILRHSKIINFKTN